MLLNEPVDQLVEPVRQLFLVGKDEIGHRAEQAQVQATGETAVHHLHRPEVSGQKVCHLLQRLDGGRAADASEAS